ncbi:MAG: hypothetical protein D6756_10640, partial [Cyanobacteria bacterium J083]
SIFTLGSSLIVAPNVLAQTAIDLSTWQQEGNPANGNWTVSTVGTSVLQSNNGNPTFFVSPDDFINSTFNGKFAVETTADNDYIGFVFGYQSPLAANSDDFNDFDFFLFDWKQANQSFSGQLAEEGFALSRVNGTINDFIPGFWGHSDSTEFDVLATDYGSDKGWLDNTEYEFTLLYQEERIKIDIDGATIFDVTPTDVGLPNFEAGKFGFYNYSQALVRYQGFTQQVTPPDPDPDPNPPSVPEPSMVLAILTIAGLGRFSVRTSKQS